MSNQGRFVWYDLMTSDPAAAIDFYGKVVGWGTPAFEIEGMPPYTMWTKGEVPIGGVMDLPEALAEQGIPPHWIGYVSVDDCDAAAARAVELGGAIACPAQDIPTIGRFAVITDPQGATIAIYTSLNELGAEASPEVGDFSWHELMSSDYAAGFEFYSELFGWEKKDEMDMGPAGIYLMYGRGEHMLGGMFTKPAEMPGPPCWLYYAKVADLDAAVEAVKEGGGQIVVEPMEVPGGDRIVQCTDPQGGFFALHASAC